MVYLCVPLTTLRLPLPFCLPLSTLCLRKVDSLRLAPATSANLGTPTSAKLKLAVFVSLSLDVFSAQREFLLVDLAHIPYFIMRLAVFERSKALRTDLPSTLHITLSPGSLVPVAQSQHYLDVPYEDDSYRGDEDLHADAGYTPPERSGRQRQYVALGRGLPPSHRRSASMNPPTFTPTHPVNHRSRSSQRSTSYDVADDQTAVRMSDMEALFQRFSIEQDERHRQHTAELEERHRQHTTELENHRRQQTELLHQRLDALENSRSSESSRGRLSNRGGAQAKRRTQRALQRGLPPPEETIEHEIDTMAAHVATAAAPAQVAEEADGDGDDGGDDGPKKKRVSDKTALQRYSTQLLRGACGIKGKDWPDPAAPQVNPTTGVAYLTPLFDADVTDAHNDSIFLDFAKVLDRQLRAKRPASISKNAVWDNDSLYKCAQDLFRTLKKLWKASQSDEAEKRAQINSRNTRLYSRRARKFKQIEDQIEAYAETYRIPVDVVRELVHEDLLSDEASGPEDEAAESPAAWKVRMAIHCGQTDLSPVALKKQQFLEVLECPWRSDEVCLQFYSVISSLIKVQFSEFSLRIQQLPSAKSKKVVYKRVRGTHRLSPRIPLTAPYDFGISREWLEEQRQNPEVAPLLQDWGVHGDPVDFEGIGVAAEPTDGGRGESVVDAQFDFEGSSSGDDL
ncbi:hypothetical protein K438DRAFT_1768027 [Mycena galopus ATCC 62051]|nr:hypothetical protein K438DRAFT_1768027 [Mycena galopus ATCC 62051]